MRGVQKGHAVSYSSICRTLAQPDAFGRVAVLVQLSPRISGPRMFPAHSHLLKSSSARSESCGARSLPTDALLAPYRRSRHMRLQKHLISLSTEGRPVAVYGSVQCTVNALNGNTVLHKIEGTLGATTVNASGSVAGTPNTPKATDLDLTVKKGRAQDLLHPFLEGQPPIAGDSLRLRRMRTWRRSVIRQSFSTD